MGFGDKLKQQDSWAKDLLIFGLSIAFIVLVNVLSFKNFTRWDLTEDQRYSLDPHTETLLEEGWLDKPMTIKIYLEGDLPADLRKLKDNIHDKLEELRAYAGSNLDYEFIDIYSLGDDEQVGNIETYLEAEGEGIMPVTLQGFSKGSAEFIKLWPGAEIIYDGVSTNFVTFFEYDVLTPEDNLAQLTNSVTNELEYKLIKGMRRAIEGKKRTVAFLNGHDELDFAHTFYARMALGESYNIQDITIDGQLNALDGVDVLIVAGPKNWPEGLAGERDLFVIDQFIMRGGKVAWFLDRVQVNEDSLRRPNGMSFVESQRGLLYDIVYGYGGRVEPIAVKDIPSAPFNSNVLWYYYPLLQGTDHPITQNIPPLRTEYPSPVKLVGSDSLQKTVILKTSPTASAVNASLPIMVPNPQKQDPPDWRPRSGFEGFDMAVLLEGTFRSPFQGLLPPEFTNSPDYKTIYRSEESSMIIAGDASIIANQVSQPVYHSGQVIPGKPFPMNYDMTGYRDPESGQRMYYGNQEFVENAVDYLVGDASLINLRTKNIILRPLNKDKVVAESGKWKMINLLVPVLSTLLLAISIWFLRRRRYTS